MPFELDLGYASLSCGIKSGGGGGSAVIPAFVIPHILLLFAGTGVFQHGSTGTNAKVLFPVTCSALSRDKIVCSCYCTYTNFAHVISLNGMCLLYLSLRQDLYP